MEGQDVLVRVHPEWRGWRSAEVPMRNLQELHWRQPPGAPHPMLHGFVSCSDIVTGDIPHDCASGPGRHRLLVCILKRHTVASVYLALTRRADQPRPLATTQQVSLATPDSNRLERVRIVGRI